MGPKGPKGDEGDPGEDATLNMTAVNTTLAQAIAPSAMTMITDMESPVVTGVYGVWFDATVTGTDPVSAVYGIYVDGVLQGFDRIFSGGYGTSYQDITCFNGEVIVSGSRTLTVEVTVTTGTMTIHRASLMIQKTQ